MKILIEPAVIVRCKNLLLFTLTDSLIVEPNAESAAEVKARVQHPRRLFNVTHTSVWPYLCPNTTLRTNIYNVAVN